MKLETYLETKILPQYSELDSAHNERHIKEVIRYADLIMDLYPKFNKRDIIITAAYYHDLGNLIERKNHHLISSDRVLLDNNLKNYFNYDDIVLISTICAQHRSSLKGKERFCFESKLLNDADTCDGSNIERCMERAYWYNKKHYKDFSMNQIKEQAYSHLVEKYGHNGYSNEFLLNRTILVVRKDVEEKKRLLLPENKKEFMERFDKVIENIIK